MPLGPIFLVGAASGLLSPAPPKALAVKQVRPIRAISKKRQAIRHKDSIL